MKPLELTDGDIKLLTEHGLAIEANVTEARKLIDDLDADDVEMLMNVLDQAQGAVHSESAGCSYVIIKIVPDVPAG